MQRFTDRVAMVTGAATGIGFGIARRLGSEGAKVFVVDVDEAGGQRAVATNWRPRGSRRGWRWPTWARSWRIAAAVDEVVAAWGRIDVLVNNAGIVGPTAPLWELSGDDLDLVYRTNLRGVFVCCRYVIPHMLAQEYGRIVNIASIAGKEGNPRVVPYSTTKAGGHRSDQGARQGASRDGGACQLHYAGRCADRHSGSDRRGDGGVHD